MHVALVLFVVSAKLTFSIVLVVEHATEVQRVYDCDIIANHFHYCFCFVLFCFVFQTACNYIANNGFVLSSVYPYITQDRNCTVHPRYMPSVV